MVGKIFDLTRMKKEEIYEVQKRTKGIGEVKLIWRLGAIT